MKGDCECLEVIRDSETGYAKNEQFMNYRKHQPTTGLFLEGVTNFGKFKDHIVEPFWYTMKDDDCNKTGAKSVRKIYMNAMDEHEAAMRVVGNMRHWRKLVASKWFFEPNTSAYDGLKQWRIDKKAQDASEAKRILFKAAEEGSVAAARKLYEEYSDKPAKPVKKKPEIVKANSEDKANKVRDMFAKAKKL